jgi:hypothetical protein
MSVAKVRPFSLAALTNPFSSGVRSLLVLRNVCAAAAKDRVSLSSVTSLMR